MMDRLEALRAFVRLVDLGTFTAAAAELQVKQSTVSKWVSALEREYQTQLIERTTRARRVTEAGHLLYERAKGVLDEYEAMVSTLQEDTLALHGSLRISVPVVFGRRYVLPHLLSFAKAHEHLRFDVVYSDRYVSLVEEGFDIAIRVGLAEDSSLRMHKLGESERYLVASPDYVSSRGTPQAPADLSAHDCLLHSGVSTTQIWQFTKGEEIHKARVQGRIKANNSEAIKQFAEAGFGIALLASWLVSDAIEAGTLVRLCAEYELPKAPIYGLMPPGRFVPPKVRRLLEHMAAAIQSSSLETTCR